VLAGERTGKDRPRERKGGRAGSTAAARSLRGEDKTETTGSGYGRGS